MPVTGIVLDKAFRDAGQIDRQLRRQHPQLPFNGPPESAQSRLTKGIASAAKPRGTTVENLVLEDGRRMTKVHGPAGVYCVIENTVGNLDGVDQLQRGITRRTTSCP